MDFKQTYVGGSLSYVKSLNKSSTNFLALGVESAFIGNSFDMTKMVGFDEETAITFGDIDSQINYVDLSVGFAWYYTFSKHSYYYLGGSISHINEPNVSFFDTNRNANTVTTDPFTDGRILYKKVAVHGGANLRLTDNITILPSFLYFDQGPHRQMNAGTYFKIQKARRGRGAPEYAVYFGAWVRFYKDTNLSWSRCSDSISAR